MSKEFKNRKTTLYSRIAIRLTLPLLLLATFFTTLQLTNQIQQLYRYHLLESKFAFRGIYNVLQTELKRKNSLEDAGLFERKIKPLVDFYPFREISIYDPAQNRTLWGNGAWSSSDIEKLNEWRVQQKLNSM